MMSPIEWQFGGWLRHWPAPLAWGVLLALSFSMLFLVVWLYRRTLRTLPLGAKLLLTALRVAIGLLLFLCLANPARVERTPRGITLHDSLAVVVDGSDSMTAPDGRGTTRLAAAVRIWKQHESEAHTAFPKTAYRRFAVSTNAAASLEEAAQPKAPGTETRLYEALHQTLADSPGAVVCLTDGLDTTSGDAASLAADAQRRGVPLYFVPGSNRSRGNESMSIREIKAPSQVLRLTEFTASTLLAVVSRREQTIPVELWSGETRFARTELPVHAGVNTLPWSVPISAKEAGPMPLEFRLGTGDKQQIVACTTQVVDHEKVEVLYYQGAMQWGYRFLLAALESDPSFHITSILNPALGVQMTAGGADHAILPDLPDDARDLKRFQIIVLAHAFADRLTTPQQRALVEYARAGGGVLFIAPETEATQRFAGTELEQMLPVVFASPNAGRSQDDLAGRLREQLAEVNTGEDDALFASSSRRQTLPRLQPFALPPGAKQSRTTALFEHSAPADLPKFSNSARVAAVKPGADVLAVRASNTVSASAAPPRVLLARQPFGGGFTAALTTDLLWRWKMSLPSTSRAAETFWQQLLLSLAPPPGTGLRLVKLTEKPSVNSGARFRVEGPTSMAAAPAVQAVSPTGQSTPLALHADPAPDADRSVWTTDLTPNVAGRWEVRATDPNRNFARMTFFVSEKPAAAENFDLPPDLEGLRQLAQSTGGALIGDEPIFQDRVASTPEGSQPRRVQPLWNSGWLLGLMLALYGTELIVRRLHRLL